MEKQIKKITLLIVSFLLLAVYAVATKAETEVETKTEVISIPDRDGDGIIDKDDPHPDYPEIYIVKDDNRNGIVDQFEQTE